MATSAQLEFIHKCLSIVKKKGILNINSQQTVDSNNKKQLCKKLAARQVSAKREREKKRGRMRMNEEKWLWKMCHE